VTAEVRNLQKSLFASLFGRSVLTYFGLLSSLLALSNLSDEKWRNIPRVAVERGRYHEHDIVGCSSYSTERTSEQVAERVPSRE
jgi:hypothetical protein